MPSTWYCVTGARCRFPLRRKVIALRDEYESHISAALEELAKTGIIPANTRLFRLFLLGALNWTVQWYRPDGGLTIDQLADGFLELMLPHQARPNGAGRPRIRPHSRPPRPETTKTRYIYEPLDF